MIDTDTVAAWREIVIDTEIVVDVALVEVDRSVAALLAAVRERDRASVHLAQLIEYADRGDCE